MQRCHIPSFTQFKWIIFQSNNMHKADIISQFSRHNILPLLPKKEKNSLPWLKIAIPGENHMKLTQLLTKRVIKCYVSPLTVVITTQLNKFGLRSNHMLLRKTIILRMLMSRDFHKGVKHSKIGRHADKLQEDYEREIPGKTLWNLFSSIFKIVIWKMMMMIAPLMILINTQS